MKDVGCNLWSGLEEAQTVLFVAVLGSGGVGGGREANAILCFLGLFFFVLFF